MSLYLGEHNSCNSKLSLELFQKPKTVEREVYLPSSTSEAIEKALALLERVVRQLCKDSIAQIKL